MKEKITLACIAGNAEKYISRFLDHFEPIADEVVIVQAQGSVKPDKTLEIAAERGCLTATYQNADDGKDWPHVDDFAAARNMAFNMASNEWVMWADLDDVIDSENAAKIRSECLSCGDHVDAVSVSYRVPEDGVTVVRERIIRKGRAEWVQPIHEYLFFEERPRVYNCTAEIVHAPIGDRKSNDERNLRIMESVEDRNASLDFHLGITLRAVGRVDDAREQMAMTLNKHAEDLGKAERYELYMSLSQMSENQAQRETFLLHCSSVDPTRPEAFGELSQVALAKGDARSALAWAEAMEAQTKDTANAWNMRRKYWGWAGKQIKATALRACGDQVGGDTLQLNHFLTNGAKISLLHATRGRARQAYAARLQWLERAENPDAIEHIFAIDADDEGSHIFMCHNHVMCPPNKGPVMGWNKAAARAQGEILVQMSDDFEPPLGWDRMIIEAIGDTSKPSVLAVSDGHRKDDLMCMAIITKERLKQQRGYLFHPDFFSMYSDAWFSWCAFHDDVVIDKRDEITFVHNHPAFTGEPLDETYKRSNIHHRYEEGEAIYERLKDQAINSHAVSS